VLENSIEHNSPPYGCVCVRTCFSCFSTPDWTSKVYFDRGPWHKFCFARSIGCINGDPTFYGHNRTYFIALTP
jgi:hypothetical protein